MQLEVRISTEVWTDKYVCVLLCRNMNCDDFTSSNKRVEEGGKGEPLGDADL